jgi:LysM repeat protein
MRVRVPALVITVAALAAPGAASAAFVHVVAPGESLTSVAAADGLSVDQLAAANGLSTTAQLVAGTGLQIPPQAGPSAAVVSAAPAAVVGDGDNDGDDVGASPTAPASSPSGGSYVVQPGDTLTGIAARAGMSVAQLAAANGLSLAGPLLSGSVLRLSGSAASQTIPVATSSPPSGGSYVVQPGDTLTGIAARAGMSVAQLAAANGLSLAGPLLSGSVLRLSGAGGGTTQSAASQPVGAAAEGSPVNPPYPTQETVSPSQVGSIAAANGVPPSLADAIAYQESGFNNGAVSTSDARGVMQILPGTWDWIQRTLVAGAPPLAPASATDNIRGGVLLLKSLLNSTGGDPALAAAGYYQGLPSVQQNGVYRSTQQYVNNVMALSQRFGGG